jgi:hypothetical protein
MMKVVWIHCSETLSREVTEILDAAGVRFYSVWKNVLGKDNSGNRTRWDDAVFPGKNWAIQFLCTGEIADDLKLRLDEFLKDPYVGDSGIVMYAAEAERVL